ncbi:phosphoribosyltransferase [Pseudochrobactrum algeriensis]|uniref:phosphoribosyltransferase n=1 Tax=Pseudochrobactrum algeriensis TaxID=2834768 RepID=UPI001BCE0928|nr:phosphoribosyltransferase [Pseudochrobactrum algeriensis]QVQ38299.1 phosphoribosyltransferase [Pseudochrobactrum algeriensis]QVQ41523.1 phosphoribosyltransferase [Pseudochrobactrum algeriensis]QVQ45447.1 phosphoribosyltransferase [Pseudochrobactrum algeriensis]
MQPHEFWQKLYAPETFNVQGVHETFFPATLDDGRQLQLPIRPLSDKQHALASLIVNQAAFDVVDALSDDLAAKLNAFEPDVIVGLPTLGLTLASEVARKLGHSRYVPLGTSRKFWYEEELSVPLSSITTPDQIKRLYIDPRMLPLLDGRRIALVDDVISSGSSIVAALNLLNSRALKPVVIGAAMLQTQRWRAPLEQLGTEFAEMTRGCFTTPMLKHGENGGWTIAA